MVRGALEAAKEFGVQIVLVGRGADILASMKAQGWDTLPDGVELANAEDVVDMHCDPAAVVKQPPNSSLVLGARMLAQVGGDAFISAGNTGALLTAATLLVKRIRGIRRAAFSPVLPTKDGHAILIDAGANAECTPEFLLQFGCMEMCIRDSHCGHQAHGKAPLADAAVHHLHAAAGGLPQAQYDAAPHDGRCAAAL